jgi:hypothetical protein
VSHAAVHLEGATVPVLYLAIGILGMAAALVGVFGAIYPLAAVGAAMIFAAFFLFVRTNQGTPAPANGDRASS